MHSVGSEYFTAHAACLILAGAIGLGGCSSDAAEEAPPDREAMAEVAVSYYSKLAECMTENGFLATFDVADMRMDVTVGDGKDADAERVEQECRSRAGERPTVAPWTEEELGDLYDQSVAAYECLLAEGYSPAVPPSFESFKAGYRSEGGEDPYIAHMSQVQFAAPFPDDVCPQPTIVP